MTTSQGYKRVALKSPKWAMQFLLHAAFHLKGMNSVPFRLKVLDDGDASAIDILSKCQRLILKEGL